MPVNMFILGEKLNWSIKQATIPCQKHDMIFYLDFVIIIGICVLIQFLIATDSPENSKLLLFVLRNSNEFRQLLIVGIVMAKKALTLDESQRIKKPTQAGRQATHTHTHTTI